VAAELSVGSFSLEASVVLASTRRQLQEPKEQEMAEAQAKPNRRCPWQPSSTIPKKLKQKTQSK
jgi:hypothetical protein